MSQNPYESPGAAVTPDAREASSPKPPPKANPRKQAFINTGAMIGGCVALGVMFGLGFSGAIPGALFGGVGATIGVLVAHLLAAVVLKE